MKSRQVIYIFISVFLALMLLSVPFTSSQAAKPPLKPTHTPTPTPTPTPTATPVTVNPCATSTPSSGAYSVTLCFTSPANGSTVSGAVTTTVTVSVTGTNPGVQRVVFYLNGAYLLTDYQSAYTFLLPTTKWQDGAYNVGVEALMRDGYTTANQAILALTFNNGITSPPVNNNTFTPKTGTTPASGSPFVVAAAGDGASGEASSAGVTNLLATLNPNLFLYLGDVYEKGSPAEFYNWYGTGGANFSSFLSITDPTIGNHEYSNSSGGAGYFDYWNNVPNYYSFNAGGWHFVSLNSNAAHIAVDKTSAEYAWLSQDLSLNAQACTIVYYHHPLYNIGPEGATTAMADIWALMAQDGVSIVLNGHDHDYQRWVPLDANGNPSPTGVTEFVAGGAGHGLQTFITTDSRVAYSNDLNPQAFGALVLSLNPSGASFSYVSSSGTTLDSGTVPCAKAGADTQAPSVPAGLTAAASNATQINLAWQASTDNVGVAGYTLYRDGAALATVPGSSLVYSDSTAQPSTTYNYTIDAFDAAGNHSSQSAPASVTTPAISSPMTFTVSADTYVNSGSPTSNYGSATVWRVDGSPDLHAYLRFSVPNLGGYAVSRARLLVYANSASSIGISAEAVADNTWNENTVTYNTAPPLGAVIGTAGAYATGTWVTIDVTSYVTGVGTYSFGITTPGSTTLSFAARESGANAAQLVIDLVLPDSQAPSVPTGLTAAASSATQVNLAWQASTDNVGVTGYTVYRDGASIGTVNGSTLTYTDNTAQPSTTYNYTVDAFDAAGNHSAQSSPAAVTTPAQATSMTFNVSADTYVNSGSPTSNYGSATVWRADGSPDLHGLLRFTVSGLNGNPVVHAYLKVYANSSSTAGINAQVISDNTWVETTVNYNTAPPLGAVIGTAGAYPSGTWVTIDVTSYVTGEGTYSFGITTPGSTQLSFAARESGVNAAQLIIAFQ